MSHTEEGRIGVESEDIQHLASELSRCSDQQQTQEKSNDDVEIKEIHPVTREKSGSTIEYRGVSKDFTEKINQEELTASSSNSSNNDICRICHMGNTSPNQSCIINNSELANRDPNGADTTSTSSLNLNLGLLVSACRCRGTVGLVHTKCLERWLTESGHTRCELCGYRYATIRVPRHGVLRSLLIWIKTFVATRQMLLDSLYLVVTTPLAVFSAYVCAMTLKMALENRINDIPWTIVAMLPTCSLTLVAYWGWLLTLQRLHGRRWRQYWQSNFIVQLVPDSPIAPERSHDEINFNHHEDPYDDLPDIFNII